MRGSAAFCTGVAPGGALAPGWVKNELWRKARTVPSLDLRFADDKSLVDATTGASLVTFTRASSGTFVGSDGVLRTAVTNLLLQSEDFSTTWIKDSNAVVTTNVATAPNGSVTADKFAVGTSTFPQIAQAATSTVSLTHSFSVYIKAAGLNFIQLRVRNTGASTNYFRAVFNLSTGAVTSAITNGTGVIVSATTVNAEDGWWRCTLTGIADTTGTSIQPLAILATDANGTLATSSNSAATDGVLLWGAQLEQSATVGEYIPTTSVINSAPRFNHNPQTGESLGLLVEEQRTNSIRNNTMVGAVAGTPGTLPTNWTIGGTGVGTLSRTISVGAQSGISYVDIRCSGTTSTTGFILAFESQTQIAALTGQTWTNSIYLALVGGSTTNINMLRHDLVERTSVGGVVLQNFSSDLKSSLSSSLLRSAYSVTLSGGATTAFLQPSIEFSFASGVAVDFTIRIGLPQLEQGAFATSVIPTTTAAATRSADVASITGSNFSSWYRQDEGSWLWDGMFNVTTGNVGIFSVFDSANPTLNRHSIRVGNTIITSGGTPSANFFQTPVAQTPARYAYGCAVNNYCQVLNSVAVTDLSGAMPVGVNSLEIGKVEATALFTNGTIRRLTFWPTRLPNSTLQSITQ